MRFEVLAGSHTDERGNSYSKGQQFQSPHPLHELFVNKFRKLPDPPTTVTRLSADAEASVDVVPSLQMDETTRPPEELGSSKKTRGSSKKTGTTPPPPAGGSDVSAEWSAESEAGFVILQVEKGFMVYDADDLSSPLNKDPLAREDVSNFIREF